MKDLTGKEHYIYRCHDEDAYLHFQMIEDIIEPENREFVKNQMFQAVEEKTAYAILDKCFLYYLSLDKERSIGCAIWGKGAPLALLTLFVEVFAKHDPDTVIMYFSPHQETEIEDFKSLVTLHSLQTRSATNKLYIRIDQLREKIDKLGNLRGVYECSS